MTNEKLIRGSLVCFRSIDEGDMREIATNVSVAESLKILESFEVPDDSEVCLRYGENESLPYDESDGTFIDENGDVFTE